MKLFHSFISVLLAFLLSAKPAEVLSQLQTSLHHAVQIFRIDPFNNLYILDESNKVHRYSSKHEWMYTYADNTLGKITYLDITDPLKPLIYKRDYGTVIILDNTLSEIDRFNIFDYGYQGVNIASTSADGHYWIYDRSEYQLMKIDRKGKRLVTSINLIELGFQDIAPQQIIERQGKVILRDENAGILLFDNFGQYMRQFPFNVHGDVQFDGQNLIFFEQGKLIIYDTRYYSEKIFPLPDINKKAGLQEVKAGKDFIYLKYSNEIDIIRRIE
ncbi:MAG TPA: hypothetical protein PKC30_12695 [Saprospiraceae bacterium]|nr:hypothetical protein [Saprospiraceae bacterium]